ncbi:hypothetical protein KIL84_004488 [Mauremys mutica]|uniref:Uncharacterized protein n=1 Tax=Mauremys mutica TaxID=74926 RepID=A0A9D3XN88_9SAUR|nr:hypothetical protein KIL84_004488 [Mauremys mutica]
MVLRYAVLLALSLLFHNVLYSLRIPPCKQLGRIERTASVWDKANAGDSKGWLRPEGKPCEESQLLSCAQSGCDSESLGCRGDEIAQLTLVLHGHFSLYPTCGLQLNLALLLNGDLRDLFVAALSVMPSCLQLRGMLWKELAC